MTTESLELEVTKINKVVGRPKNYYVVKYNGLEYYVPMFGFQNDEPKPDKIKCIIDDKGQIRQDLHVLFDRYYKAMHIYRFKVKNKFAGPKYYELEDERIKHEDVKLTLPFSESNENLEKGQVIECMVKMLTDKKPLLVLTDDSPCTLDFLDKHEFFEFEDNDGFEKWLSSIFKEDTLYNVNDAYEAEDGEWIYLFSKEMEYAINSLLLSKLNDKSRLLTILCEGWINTIVHSTFMGKMTEKEKQKYNVFLTGSIEICEDYIDAIAIPDMNEAADKLISSLNPDYYQYKIEKKFRSLAYIFSLSPEILEKYSDALLSQIGKLGEDVCNGNIYPSVSTILELYSQIVTDKWMNCVSIPYEARKDIRKGILTLCYLTKIKNKHGVKANIYASRLYILLSLYMSDSNEKELSLKNSYKSMFTDIHPIINAEWNRLEDIVKSGLYYFCKDNVETDSQKVLYYENGTSAILCLPNEISFAPLNYKDGFSRFKISDSLSASICYDGNLSRLDSENNFIEVRNAWNDACNTLFTPVKGIERKELSLFDCDGDTVDIYVTEIIDENTACCKAIGYKEEGTVLFNDLLFNGKPHLSIEDFKGTDGSGLLFKAVCRIKGDDGITFEVNDFKIEFAKSELQVNSEINCLVLSKNRYGAYICVTDKGFFVYVKAEEDLEIRSFINAYITSVQPNGNANAEYQDTIPPFYGKGAYATYLKLFNQFCYESEWTLDKARKQQAMYHEHSEDNVPVKMSKEAVLAIMDVFNKMSELERNPRRRYGYIALCRMMSHIVGLEGEYDLYNLRMKFCELLYDFSLNNKLHAASVADFSKLAEKQPSNPEVSERKNIIAVLSKFKSTTSNNRVDLELVNYLKTSESPIVEKLSRLILSSNLLSNFLDSSLHDKVLDEIGRVVNIEIVKPKHIHLGEESQTLEFKTSLVYPPNNQGKDDIEQQSENIVNVILAMMNVKGGTLYIGVNDYGDVVGLYNDLLYFSESGQYNEVKAKDNFKNKFSCILKDGLGAEDASKFNFDFEKMGDYWVFKVEIPVIHVSGNTIYRVGNTVQIK